MPTRGWSCHDMSTRVSLASNPWRTGLRSVRTLAQAPAAARYPRCMDPRWHDGVGPSGTSLNHPTFKQYRRMRDASRWEVVALLILVAICNLAIYIAVSFIWAVGITLVGSSVYLISKILVQRWSRNHPDVKGNWWFRRANRWDTAALFLVVAGVPATIYLTDSLAWTLPVAVAGPVLYLVLAALAYCWKRFASSTKRERDRLAAENARLKARLRRIEHGK